MAAILLISGFSTKKEATDISGRGVGLDAVHSEIQNLGGNFQVVTKSRRRGLEPQLIFRLALSDQWLQFEDPLSQEVDEGPSSKAAG